MNIVQWLYRLSTEWVTRLGWVVHKESQGAPDDESMYFESGEKTVWEDWMQVNEQLHPLVRKLQSDIGLVPIHALTFDLLGVSSYLLQIDICLSKNKKYYDLYRKRVGSIDESVNEGTLKNATKQCQEGYCIIQQCYALLKEGALTTIQVKKLSDLARLFDSQTQETAQAIQLLNNEALKKGSLYSLVESDLFKALYNLEQSESQYKPYLYSPLKESMSYGIATLRREAQDLTDPDLKFIADSLINQYESVSKYMIFSASDSLNKAFKAFYSQTRQFIQEGMDLTQDDSVRYTLLSSIFREVESIRFITNKKDPFTKNLQQAAKVAAKQLRKNLESSALGLNFLKMAHTMNTQEKLDMKSRFK